MDFLFHKTVNAQTYNCTKKDTGVFLWIYLCEYIFIIFYFFVSEKINICLIVKVLLLRRIMEKVFNNVNKIKSTCENLTSEVM